MDHAQFETIHAFVDGNGRTGRALIHVILRRRGLAPRMSPPVSLVLATWSAPNIQGLVGTRHAGPPNSDAAHDGLNRWIALCRRAVEDALDVERKVDDIEARGERLWAGCGPVQPSSFSSRHCPVPPSSRSGWPPSSSAAAFRLPTRPCVDSRPPAMWLRSPSVDGIGHTRLGRSSTRSPRWGESSQVRWAAPVAGLLSDRPRPTGEQRGQADGVHD